MITQPPALNQIRKPLFHASELPNAERKEECGDSEAGQKTGPVNVGFPKNAPSFEDRNDKNDIKEAAAGDIPVNVELEVMTGDDDKAVEVVESTNADEHERSPPDVAVCNLIDL